MYNFLEESFERYKKFLKLRQKYPRQFLVPCYDIDLMWHTHQVNPTAYIHDCLSNFGTILPHDDTDSDRSVESRLSLSFDTTKTLWRDAFQEEYSKPGAMYRGPAPGERVLLSSESYEEFGFEKMFNLTLDSLSIGPFIWPKVMEANVQAHLVSKFKRSVNSKLLFEAPIELGRKSILSVPYINRQFQITTEKENYVAMTVVKSAQVS